MSSDPPFQPNNTPRLVLRIRQGFIKLALRYGLPLVPIYIYGEKYVHTCIREMCMHVI